MALEWMQFLLPEVPTRIGDEVSEAKFLFSNCFTGSITICEIKKNEMTLESDNLSTV